MHKYMKKSKALRHITLTFLLCFSSLSSLYSAPKLEPQMSEATEPERSVIPPETGPGYTINFNNVSIIEYIKFISKIANLNFVYDEKELQFNVTIVSEEATSLVNVMSALVQILKVNGFGLIEQGNNLLITKSGTVSQIATVVSQESPLEEGHIPPIMTRVFKIKNTNPSIVGQLLNPLLSKDAILEVSAQTRHVIITDITQNIEEVQKLLLSLDAAKSPLSIDTYTTRNNSPETLIGLANQIIIPISEGNPIIYVPQDQTNTIFIVSTPYLIEKSLMVFEDLDNPPSLTQRFSGPITGSNILLYHIVNKPADVLQNAVRQIEAGLSKIGPASEALVQTLNTMRYIRESHSLAFVGTPQTLSEVNDILVKLDVPYSASELEYLKSSFYLYPIKYGDEQQISRSLDKFVQTLKKAEHPPKHLIETIDTMQWIKENNSLLFYGDESSINRLKEVLPTFDIPTHEGKTSSRIPLSNDFYVYTPKHLSGEALLKQIKDIDKSLKAGNLADPAFLHALSTVEWLPSTHSLVFTGDAQSLDRVHALLNTIDQTKGPPEEDSTFYIYKVAYVDPGFLEQGLQKTAKTLTKGSPIAVAIDNSKYIKDTNSFVFRGTPNTINRIKDILSTIDTQENEKEASSQFYVYRPTTMTAPDYLAHLKEVADEMQASGLSDPTLIDTLESARLVPDKTAVMFTGTPQAISKIREVAPTFDSSMKAKATQLYVYKPISMSPQEFQKNMVQTAADLKKSGLHDAPLIEAFKSARVSSDGSTVIFTGTPDAIAKLNAMVPAIDEENEAEQANKIYIYTPTNRSPEDLVKAANQAANEMQDTPNPNISFITALKSGKIVGHGKSVLFTGTPDAISKLKEMVPAFDSAKAATSGFFVYKPKAISAQELQKRSLQVAEKLQEAGLNDPQLLEALESAKLTPSGDAVTFVGTPAAISRLENMIPSYDSGMQAEKATQFFVYQPQNMTAQEFQQRMIDAGNTFEESGLADPNLIRTLKTSQITSGGKAVLFTGTPESISHIREIAEKYDQHQEAPEKATQFFVYTPKSISADDLRRHLRLFAENMEAADLADPALLKTLNSAKLVSNGKSVLFTGTEASINSLKEILPTIDQEKEEEVKTVGKTTFVVYKIKNVPGPVLMGYLRDLANDFERAQSTDKGLIKTLQNMRYVKETNSIIFTGTPKDLKEATTLAAKFDIPELAGEQPVRSPSGYLIYKPKYVPGQQLILILRDFEQNLLSSGVNDAPLFDTINNLKWMQQVSSIVVTGNDDDTQKVYSLLERFDTPGPGIAGDETGIESISDMSFLIYKLQYHSGGEIQSALQKIGDDLAKLKSDKVNQGLVDAIKAVQWIEVTNSLISTGESDSLAKLKELIKSIDIPLRQVFVEILVIETNISNALNFGLRWGSQGVYREKFAYGTGSFPQPPGDSAPDPLADFSAGLGSLTSTTTPTGTMIPFVTGFDLGVIGDIILHKGKSYFGLGSVIDALKADNDTTIALNQKVITQDNKNATIFVGQNLPYTGSIVTNTGNNATVQNSNLEYRDVGVSLSITPQIGDNDTVTLNINQEITENLSSSGSSNTSPITLNGIATSKTTTQTSVTVPDKAFLILSGQIDNTLTSTRTSIPCLGGLPLIGAAFSQNDSLSNKNSVIIFVRPHIIKSFDVYKEITTHQEDLHRAQTDDVEAFEAGLELVKTPDDY